MQCLTCGKQMKTRKENVKYDACGLSNVTLASVEVSRCQTCGEYEVSIPQIEDLHKALAQSVIRKPGRLNAEEVRFLRKYLGWSGADFAEHMGAKRETVSRWETGAAQIGSAADRLLRLMVVNQAPVNDYSLDLLRDIAKNQSVRTIRLQMNKEGWFAEAA